MKAKLISGLFNFKIDRAYSQLADGAVFEGYYA